MSVTSHFIFDVPEETARVARQAFPKGDNVYMKMRDELELTYHDDDFIELYSYTGQPAKSPAFLDQSSDAICRRVNRQTSSSGRGSTHRLEVCLRVGINRQQF